MQAFGGIMSVVGEEGRPPVRVGPSIIDQGTAMWGVIGILVGALSPDAKPARAAWWTCRCSRPPPRGWRMYAAQYLGSGELPMRHGSGAPGIVPYRAYRTKDGDLVVAAGNDGLFRKLCEVLGIQVVRRIAFQNQSGPGQKRRGALRA